MEKGMIKNPKEEQTYQGKYCVMVGLGLLMLSYLVYYSVEAVFGRINPSVESTPLWREYLGWSVIVLTFLIFAFFGIQHFIREVLFPIEAIRSYLSGEFFFMILIISSFSTGPFEFIFRFVGLGICFVPFLFTMNGINKWYDSQNETSN